MHIPPTDMPGNAGHDIRTLRSLVPFLWAYRGRVLLALGFLVLAKVANVGIPLVLKQIVDSLDAGKHATLALPLVLLLIGYGALKLTSSLFNELRDSVFARVRHGAMRQVSVKVLEHLHRLSLRFHLERKTGGLSRDIERGTRSVSSLLNYMVFSILPTLVEITMIAGILLARYEAWFAVITFVAVVVYIAFTMFDHRMAHEVPRHHECLRFQGQYPGHRQPAELRDRKILRQRRPRTAALRETACTAGRPRRSRARPRCRHSISARRRSSPRL